MRWAGRQYIGFFAIHLAELKTGWLKNLIEWEIPVKGSYCSDLPERRT
jgi:hypothetical protein